MVRIDVDTPSRRYAVTIEDGILDRLPRLLDGAGIARASLVGHSLGALAVLHAASRHASRVDRIAMLGPAAPMTVSEGLLAAAAIASEEAAFATPGVKIGLFCTTPMVALTRAIFLARRLKSVWAGQNLVGILLPPSGAGALVNFAALLLGKTPVNLHHTASEAWLAACAGQCDLKTVVTSLCEKRFFRDCAGKSATFQDWR